MPHTVQDCGLPAQAAVDLENTVPAEECPTCGIDTDCPRHPCKCLLCLKGGTSKMACKWRVLTKKFLRCRKAHSVRKLQSQSVEHRRQISPNALRLRFGHVPRRK